MLGLTQQQGTSLVGLGCDPVSGFASRGGGDPSRREMAAVLPLPAVPHASGAGWQLLPPTRVEIISPVSLPQSPAVSNALLINLWGQGDFTLTFKSADPDCKYPGQSTFEDARIISSSNSLCNLF